MTYIGIGRSLERAARQVSLGVRFRETMVRGGKFLDLRHRVVLMRGKKQRSSALRKDARMSRMRRVQMQLQTRMSEQDWKSLDVAARIGGEPKVGKGITKEIRRAAEEYLALAQAEVKVGRYMAFRRTADENDSPEAFALRGVKRTDPREMNLVVAKLEQVLLYRRRLVTENERRRVEPAGISSAIARQGLREIGKNRDLAAEIRGAVSELDGLSRFVEHALSLKDVQGRDGSERAADIVKKARIVLDREIAGKDLVGRSAKDIDEGLEAARQQTKALAREWTLPPRIDEARRGAAIVALGRGRPRSVIDMVIDHGRQLGVLKRSVAR